jgi:high-affinity iron transporter
VVLLAFLAVGREGVETSVFLWAAAQSATDAVLPALGAALGILTAIGLGVLIAKGMVKVNLGRFFAITGAVLILVAAGVLSHGVGDLQAAGLLPGRAAMAYDITAAVPAEGWLATLAGGLLGISPVATWLEVAVWLGYAAVVSAGFALALRSAAAPRIRTATAH